MSFKHFHMFWKIAISILLEIQERSWGEEAVKTLIPQILWHMAWCNKVQSQKAWVQASALLTTKSMGEYPQKHTSTMWCVQIFENTLILEICQPLCEVLVQGNGSIQHYIILHSFYKCRVISTFNCGGYGKCWESKKKEWRVLASKLIPASEKYIGTQRPTYFINKQWWLRLK